MRTTTAAALAITALLAALALGACGDPPKAGGPCQHALQAATDANGNSLYCQGEPGHMTWIQVDGDGAGDH